MKTHQNYVEINADTHYDLGLRRGELFGEFLRGSLARRKRHGSWKIDLDRARSYVAPTQQAFPQLIEEVHGYAEGARVCFEETWTMILEDELTADHAEKCTTIVTNRGSLVGHNEDWERDAEEAICVLRKSVRGVTTLELCYMNTLGGNAISVNSHGFVHAVNSLSHADHQIGVPKNLVARWLSESSAPETDFAKLEQLERASGYHHCLVSAEGQIWSMECAARRQVLTRPPSPFVHTNHFLTSLSQLEGDDNIPGTRKRFRCASEKATDLMSVEQMKRLLSDTSEGRRNSILNERTIGRMVIDLKQMMAHVWLLREKERGWLSYPLAADRALGRSTSRSPVFDSIR